MVGWVEGGGVGQSGLNGGGGVMGLNDSCESV